LTYNRQPLWQIRRQNKSRCGFVFSYIICFLLFLSKSVDAEPATIRVVDQNGAPIEGVVVSTQNNQPIIMPDAPAIMDQIDTQFIPRVLIINKGQYVNFPNSDDVRHHVYSFSATKQFEIGLYKGLNAEPVHFAQPGIVDIGCNIHDQMVGFIYVGDNENVVMSNDQGEARFESLGRYFHLWHPRLSADKGKRLKVETNLDSNSRVQTVELQLLPEAQSDDNDGTFGSRKRFRVAEQ